MTKAPTVYDVAAHAGVSIATVSRVLRRPDDVRPETRARVLDSVRSLGYVPSGAARGLAGRRHGVLGLFLPGHDGIDLPEPDWERVADASRIPLIDDREGRPTPPAPTGTGTGTGTGAGAGTGTDAPRTASNPANLYFDEVLRGAEVESWRRGFALMVAAGRGSSREVMLNDIAGRVDGLAVLAQTVPDDLLAHVSRRIPVVVLADSRPGDELDHVSVDNSAGMRALTAFVLGRSAGGVHGAGGRVSDVVYVAGPGDSPDEADRHRGFDEAVAAAMSATTTAAATTAASTAGRDRDRGPIRVRVERGDFSREGGRRAGEALVASSDPLPQAVVCANDQSALGVLDAFVAHGVDVPGRVAVTGFDGIEAGRFSTPRLTTVRQPMNDLGRVAVRTIVTRLTDPTAPPQRVTLPVEVLLRESCPAR